MARDNTWLNSWLRNLTAREFVFSPRSEFTLCQPMVDVRLGWLWRDKYVDVRWCCRQTCCTLGFSSSVRNHEQEHSNAEEPNIWFITQDSRSLSKVQPVLLYKFSENTRLMTTILFLHKHPTSISIGRGSSYKLRYADGVDVKVNNNREKKKPKAYL